MKIKIIMSQKENEVGVIVVPFPAQGHLNQLLQLSCIISSSYGLPVHYLASTIHNHQAQTRATLDITKIHFHDLPTPPVFSPSPDPNAIKNFPGHLQSAFDASFQMREPFIQYLQSISSTFRRIVVIYDPLIATIVQDVGLIPNAEAYQFNCISVLMTICLLEWAGGESVLEIKSLTKDLPSLEECITDDFKNFIHAQFSHTSSTSGSLFNTCKLIEGTFLNLLPSENLWPVGPLLHLNSSGENKCLAWLDKQPLNSVIYVSFGTTNSMSQETINKLAKGLEDSGQKFMWVLRDADKADIFTGKAKVMELPEGFEERMKEYGMVIRDWAHQTKILAHPSIGGFMSHCGWNSCIESITQGVPIAAWPMHSDQPWNALLVTEILKVGLNVMKWTPNAEELVTSSTISSVVRSLMVSEEGNEIRKRAEELGSAIRRSSEEGGVSRLALDSFIAHITR